MSHSIHVSWRCTSLSLYSCCITIDILTVWFGCTDLLDVLESLNGPRRSLEHTGLRCRPIRLSSRISLYHRAKDSLVLDHTMQWVDPLETRSSSLWSQDRWASLTPFDRPRPEELSRERDAKVGQDLRHFSSVVACLQLPFDRQMLP